VRIVTGYATPEDAVGAETSVHRRYARVVAVDYSPDATHAVVSLEFNKPSTVEPYVVLCESTPSGWRELGGGSGDGVSWMATSADGARGVEVAWGRPPAVRWDVPQPDKPRPPPDADGW
jgi:hypothetical protein